MGFIGWLSSAFSVRQRTLRVFWHGQKRARRNDHERAIVDFTEAVETVGVPSDVKAMALYNRAIAYAAIGNKEQEIRDIDSVLVMDGLLSVVNVKTMARQMLAEIESHI